MFRSKSSILCAVYLISKTTVVLSATKTSQTTPQAKSWDKKSNLELPRKRERSKLLGKLSRRPINGEEFFPNNIFLNCWERDSIGQNGEEIYVEMLDQKISEMKVTHMLCYQRISFKNRPCHESTMLIDFLRFITIPMGVTEKHWGIFIRCEHMGQQYYFRVESQEKHVAVKSTVVPVHDTIVNESNPERMLLNECLPTFDVRDKNITIGSWLNHDKLKDPIKSFRKGEHRCKRWKHGLWKKFLIAPGCISMGIDVVKTSYVCQDIVLDSLDIFGINVPATGGARISSNTISRKQRQICEYGSQTCKRIIASQWLIDVPKLINWNKNIHDKDYDGMRNKKDLIAYKNILEEWTGSQKCDHEDGLHHDCYAMTLLQDVENAIAQFDGKLAADRIEWMERKFNATPNIPPKTFVDDKEDKDDAPLGAAPSLMFLEPAEVINYFAEDRFLSRQTSDDILYNANPGIELTFQETAYAEAVVTALAAHHSDNESMAMPDDIPIGATSALKTGNRVRRRLFRNHPQDSHNNMKTLRKPSHSDDSKNMS